MLIVIYCLKSTKSHMYYLYFSLVFKVKYPVQTFGVSKILFFQKLIYKT